MNLIKSKFNLIILISFFSHILASYFSTGWLNADEQSCVLEYVNFKLGYQSDPCFLNTDKDSVNSSSLIIRSWFQPFIYFVIAKILLFFNLTNFFSITFILKLLSSLLGFWAIYFFYQATKKYIKDNDIKKFYFIFIFLFWFFPLLHARTSAENLSTSFLIIALSYYLINTNKLNILKLINFGMLLGCAFVFRYNVGVSIAFILFWILFFENNFLSKKISNLIFIIFGIIILIFIEQLTNFWGIEGENFITKINFFDLNYIIDKTPSIQFFLYGSGNNFYSSSDWSNHPFFGYFYLTLFKYFPPISILVIISLLYTWLFGYQNIIVWATLPYFIIHSLVPHKELRYIYPVLVFAPFFICYFLDKTRINKQIKNFIIKITLVLNFFGLILFTFTSQTSELKILEKIYFSEIRDVYYINSTNSVKNYESLNPFNIKNISTNYYFKFNKISYYEKVDNKEILLRNSFCQKSDCVKFEHNLWKNNNGYINFKINLKNNQKNEFFIHLVKSDNVNEIQSLVKKQKVKSDVLILTKDFDTSQHFSSKNNCKLIDSKYPRWIYEINPKKIKNITLFKCSNF